MRGQEGGDEEGDSLISHQESNTSDRNRKRVGAWGRGVGRKGGECGRRELQVVQSDRTSDRHTGQTPRTHVRHPGQTPRTHVRHPGQTSRIHATDTRDRHQGHTSQTPGTDTKDTR